LKKHFFKENPVSKKTTTQKVLEYLIKNPDAPAKDVAARFKTGISYVYSLRKKLKEPKRKITLTKSQVEVAKKLGVSLQDYVKEGLNMGVLKYDDEVREQDIEWQPPEMVPMPIPQDLTVANIEDLLNDRAKDYGKFKDGAALMQSIKRLLAEHARVHDKLFADDQWEAIEMIVHKLGRILNGNPDKVDNWVDIAGYATLVADRLEGNAR
jgi:hypothetical protein